MNKVKTVCICLLICQFGFRTVQAQAVAQKISLPPVPATIDFATEKVPLDNPIVYEQLQLELTKNVYKHSSTLAILQRAGLYKERIMGILRKNKVPDDFFYLAVIESELWPYANSGKAAGFWQFRDTTAKEYKLEVSRFVDQRRDLELSTQAACNFLNNLNKTFNNWTLTAAAYNSGRTSIMNTQKAQGVQSYYDLHLTLETNDYVFRILALKIICENPAAYGYEVSKSPAPEILEVVEIKEDVNLIELAQKYKINYKTLKYYNPWLVYNPGAAKTDKYYEQNKWMNVMLEVKPGQGYKIMIPKKQ
ncbi:lytic transglycosylase domain-containing protein [Emticicia sp. 21SJ11W-3]|uniref:lytic transglycosylase domain-containing protein n=1 Tax=Emticicia sp. 21SJ11W-3 TaxID=2916755 RepID=UPI0020A044FF|nr:lytic transglycosylase domain-containing protein [Emticicia sp. 21SJ11W-3]UTA67718.1 lytic transglycosylase domain-containing protein [Emticicia sp. 21SJ11W-3]